MIESALKGLRIKIMIVNPRARILQLAFDDDQFITEIDDEMFMDENTKEAVCLIVSALHPLALKAQF